MHSFRNPNIGIMVLDWRLKYPPLLLMNNAGMEKMRRTEKENTCCWRFQVHSSDSILFPNLIKGAWTQRERLLKYFCSKSGNLLFLKMCKGGYEPRLPHKLFGNWLFLDFNFMHNAPIERSTITTYLLCRQDCVSDFQKSISPKLRQFSYRRQMFYTILQRGVVVHY